MLINFNIEKLDKLLYDFHSLTGLTISIWDAGFRQLSFQPKDMRSFCRLIKQSPKGKQRCLLSDKAVCIACAKEGKPVTHHCHAGLVDTAVPIKFRDTIIGYIMFGQIKDGTYDHTEKLKALSHELQIDFDLISKGYTELEIYDKDKISAAANILKMATRYLWLSEYIDIGYNTVASQLDDYIRTHIAGDLSVKSICSAFSISKNKLYSITRQRFQKTIGQYITAVRIEEAKKLLCSTDIPIHQIAVMIGMDDYNYFTKVFKSHVGIPPLKYRRDFPFNLHDTTELSLHPQDVDSP